MNKLLRIVIVSFLSVSNLSFAVSSSQFIQWWEEYSVSHPVQKDLRVMVETFVKSPTFSDSSEYWNYLNKKNIIQITELGYINFKQTVAQNYFTWVVGVENPYASSLAYQPIGVPLTEIDRKHDFISQGDSKEYNTVTAKLLSYILSLDQKNFLSRIEEPVIGNPLYIQYQGKRITQDLLNSLLEYISMDLFLDFNKVHTVLEIGAGSGRTAYSFLTLLDGIKYIIADIPPALYLSQQYLSSVFPNKKIFKYRPFANFSDVLEEFQSADLIFLMPDQLSMIPNKAIDLFLAIDCLHEMKPDVIKFYIAEADRLASYFYMKCWQYTQVPFDSYRYSWGNYPIPTKWQTLFDLSCHVPSNFFHSFYEIKN